MAARVIDITKYSPRSSDVFLFDTSVWMLLFCPLGTYEKRKQEIYSSFLARVRSSRSSIFINSLILSEFTNANMKQDFDLWKKETSQFNSKYKRDFVGACRYKKTAQTIIFIVGKILSICEKGTDNLNSLDINRILNHFQSIEFNDSYYLELSSFSQYKIVTDDRDFIKCTNHNTEVITIIR